MYEIMTQREHQKILLSLSLQELRFCNKSTSLVMCNMHYKWSKRILIHKGISFRRTSFLDSQYPHFQIVTFLQNASVQKYFVEEVISLKMYFRTYNCIWSFVWDHVADQCFPLLCDDLQLHKDRGHREGTKPVWRRLFHVWLSVWLCQQSIQ